MVAEAAAGKSKHKELQAEARAAAHAKRLREVKEAREKTHNHTPKVED